MFDPSVRRGLLESKGSNPLPTGYSFPNFFLQSNDAYFQTDLNRELRRGSVFFEALLLGPAFDLKAVTAAAKLLSGKR